MPHAVGAAASVQGVLHSPLYDAEVVQGKSGAHIQSASVDFGWVWLDSTPGIHPWTLVVTASPPPPSPSPLSPYHAVRVSLPDHRLYSVSSRNISAPIPGPLPNPSFSFGIANASSNSERNSPVDFSGFSFPRDDANTEDASYQMSRFGSIASESTATSACFSDVGGTVEAPNFGRNARRESCPTVFLNLISGLDVNAPRRRVWQKASSATIPTRTVLNGTRSSSICRSNQ
ncbi:hypothetical protein B0H14DRAFT_3526179 [Mycena olivaceomarginata]|nr:hypothetical protein B0H14DRAFT_3526179 [Mycena olivaceomarginata]